MASRARPVAANDNLSSRRQMLRVADDILKANPEQKEPSLRIRYRGTRPAWNWLKKHDEAGAAAFWLFARERLPEDAANDNEPVDGLGADRRRGGKLRGRNSAPLGIDAYLSLPGIKPRLGDPHCQPSAWSGWFSDVTTIKPQRKPGDFPLHRHGSFTKCAPAIAPGAFFLGLAGGLGQEKMGKRRGDVRRVDAADLPDVPDDINNIIELVLSGANVADIGRALGARGGYADRRGGAALLAAGKWAKMAIAA
ncbi:hypothetical protein GGE45_002713 [Rhizobium aethiopicum]|uniref:hypothetical protein n=1 Tax=Rhizobium aethiopicum TaxID=1138170 RepID=UPI00160E2AFC|nr:hypothetical protein [Rhizobium aethiopicum]MBB4580383.1 hypothetical protein [Rhizobium aethiopicum]